MKTILTLALSVLCAVGGLADDDLLKQAGDNLGRTEADDENPEADVSEQLGSLGPIQIPFTMEVDGTATLALYTPSGRLVRILGQVLPLKAGQYTMRWDGLDLFGQPVEPATELVFKKFYNKPLRATYEFSVDAPKVAPWIGQYDGRAGGWLADHSPPSSATAVGDKVLLGSSLAEHGDNLIAVNLQGEKLWGAKLAGWTGCTQLTTDGEMAYALIRRETIQQVNPHGQVGKGTPVYSAGRDQVQAFAATGGKLYVVKRNASANPEVFTKALGNGDIDFIKSRPQILNNDAPTEFTIGAQTAFGNVLTTPGNPQNNAGMIIKNRDAYVIFVFKKPVTIGTVLLGHIPGAAKAQVFALPPGKAYDESLSPLRDDGGIDLSDFDSNWQLLGECKPSGPMHVLTVPTAGFATSAIYVRCQPSDLKNLNWKPGLKMLRLLRDRFTTVDLPATAKTSWKLKTEVPVSDIIPLDIEMDLGAETAIDGLVVMNCVNPDVKIEARIGSDWVPVGHLKARQDKRLRWLSASKSHHEQYVSFKQRVTTRTVRFRHEAGHKAGKWGSYENDSYRVETDGVALLRLAGERPQEPSHTFEVYDLASKKSERQWRSSALDFPVLTADPEGKLFTVVGGKLARVEVGSEVKTVPISDTPILRAMSIAANRERIAVGDGDQRAVRVFDKAGKLVTTIGDKGVRKRGPWSPDVVERPSGVAIAADGSIWVAEELFSPKRVARYAADGSFLEEFLGPPMYGGGGYLDPNGKAFYYRSMEYALDWVKGTARLLNLNDRLRTPETPDQANNSFTYTSIGRPILHKGRRYIVAPNTICLLEGATWRPCVVMGAANSSPFLLGKEVWKRHWAKLDLDGKSFIWCDVNGDGQYQVEEVEIFDDAKMPGLFGGLTIGPELQFWGHRWRTPPPRITDAGVPLVRSTDFMPFDYDQLAPHFSRNYTLGGPRSAKPTYNAFKYITATGALVQEGQPFIVDPDGTIRGGAPTTKPSNYVPGIDGTVLQQPWMFVGGGVTKSAVGEIAVINSNLGYWYVWAVDHGVCIGTFFTGATGGWGWGMPVQRGLDVTGRKQAWEGWGGHFVKTEDGQYLATAGKGFHAISRVDGLDDYQISTAPVKVTAEQARLAAMLRPLLAARAQARPKEPRELVVPPLADRVKNFRQDGELDDWGRLSRMPFMGTEKQQLYFDVAMDPKGLWIAFNGQGRPATRAVEWRELFRAGFAIDIQCRPNPNARSREAVAGDRRIVLSPVDGKWVGVVYEAGGSAEVFETPLARSVFARVAKLPDDAFRLAWKDDPLGFDPNTLDDMHEQTVAPTLPGTAAPKKKTGPASKPWTGELFLPWATLGSPQGGMRFDIGIIQGDTATYWSNQQPRPTGDLAWETMLNPGAWGSLRWK